MYEIARGDVRYQLTTITKQLSLKLHGHVASSPQYPFERPPRFSNDALVDQLRELEQPLMRCLRRAPGYTDSLMH